MNCKRLFPPPFEIAEMLYYTIGQDPNVQVGYPVCIEECCYEILIKVDYRGQAELLREIVPYTYQYGNSHITTKVVWCDEEIVMPCVGQKNQRQVAQLFCGALRNNYLFRGVMLNPQSCIPLKSSITVCIYPRRMPVGGDQGCNTPCKGHGEWANELFAQVLKLNYGLLISTEIYFKCCADEEFSCCNLYCNGNY